METCEDRSATAITALKIYLINLDRSPGRLAHMDRQLRDLELSYERVSAVDGSALPEHSVAGWGRLSPTQIGCFLSQRRVWEMIADGDDPYAIILEDDIHIAPSFAAFARSSDWIPADAGLVKFETIMWRVSVDRAPVSRFNGTGLFRLRSFHPGTAAYLISAKAADAFRNTFSRLSEPVDDAIFRVDDQARGLPPIYQLDPAPCIQDVFLPSASKDPALATTIQPLPSGRLGPVAKLEREFRRLRRQVTAVAAVAIGARPVFVRRSVPFAADDGAAH